MKKGIKVIIAVLLSFTITLNITAFAEIPEELIQEKELVATEETDLEVEVNEPIVDNDIENAIDDTKEIEEIKNENKSEEEDSIESPVADAEETLVTEEIPTDNEDTSKSEDEEDQEEVEDDELDEENIVDTEITDEVKTDETSTELATEVQERLILSLISQVEPLNHTYNNGDTLDYPITIINDGNIPVYNIFIEDQLGLEKRIDILFPNESEIIYGEYSIPIYNELEQLENDICIYTDYEDKELIMDLNFKVDVYIPRGSISITADADYVDDENLEFDIYIKGPNNTEYVVSLKNRESAVIDNLFIGEYTIIPIESMNYTTNRSEINILIMPDCLDHDRWISYSQNNANGFYSRSAKNIQGFRVDSRDIANEISKFLKESEEKREVYIFLDLGYQEVEQSKETILNIPKVDKNGTEDGNIVEPDDKEDTNNENNEDIKEEAINDESITTPVISPGDKKVDEVTELIEEDIKDEIKLPEEIPLIKDTEEELITNE